MLQNGVLVNPDINQAVQNHLNRSAFVAIPPTVYNPRFPHSPATLYATPDVPPGAPGVRIEDSVLSRIINAMNSLPPGSRAQISPSVFEEIEPILFSSSRRPDAIQDLSNNAVDPPPILDSPDNRIPIPNRSAENDAVNPDLLPLDNSTNSEIRPSLSANVTDTSSIHSMNSHTHAGSSSVNSSTNLDTNQGVSTSSNHDADETNANILNAFSDPGTNTLLGYRGMHTPTLVVNTSMNAPAATPFNHMSLLTSPSNIDILQRSISRGVNLISPIHVASTGNATIANLKSDLNTFAAPSNICVNPLATSSAIPLNLNNMDILQRAASVGINVGTNATFSNTMFPSNSGNIPANFLSKGVDFAKPSMFSNPDFSNSNQRPATSFDCAGKPNKRSAKASSTVKRKYSKKSDTSSKYSKNASKRHKISDAKLPPITPSENGLSGLNLPSVCGLQLLTTSNANGNFISPSSRAFPVENSSSNFALNAMSLMASSGAVSNRSTPFSNVLDSHPSFTLDLNATNLPSRNFLNASAILNANAIAQLSSTFGSPAPSQNSPFNQDVSAINTSMNYATSAVNLPTVSDSNFANSLSLSNMNVPSTSLPVNMDLANSIDYSEINVVDMDELSTPLSGSIVLDTPTASDANITASSSNLSANILDRSSSVETEVLRTSPSNIVANSIVSPSAGYQIHHPSPSHQMIPNSTGAIQPSHSDLVAINHPVATSSQFSDQNEVDPMSRHVPGTSSSDVILIAASSNEPGTSSGTSSSTRESLQNDLPSGPSPMQLLIDAISEEIDAEEEVLNNTKQAPNIAQRLTQQSTQQPVENEIPAGPVDTANLLDGYDFDLVPPNIQDVVLTTQRQLLLLEEHFNMRPNVREIINSVDRANWDFDSRSFRPMVIPQAIERPLRRQYKPRNKNLEIPAPLKTASKVAAPLPQTFDEQFFKFLWTDGKRISPSTSGSRQMVSQPAYMQQIQNFNVTSNRTNSFYRNNGQTSDDMETETTQGTSNSKDHIFKKPSSAGVRRKTRQQDFEKRKLNTTGTTVNSKLDHYDGSYQTELEISSSDVQHECSSSNTGLDHQVIHTASKKSTPKNVRNLQSSNLLKWSIAGQNAGNHEDFGESIRDPSHPSCSVKKLRVIPTDTERSTLPVLATLQAGTRRTEEQRMAAKEERRTVNGNKIGRPLGSSRINKAYLSRTPNQEVTPNQEEKEDGGNTICLWGTCRMEFADHSLFVEHVSNHVVSDGAHYKKCLWNGCVRTTPFDAFYKIQTHVRGHTREKPFHCNEPGCEKAYLRMENLRTHQRVHTGERPYVCRVCEKNFTNSSDCEKHLKRVHSSEKHHPCLFPGCDRNYTDPSSLRKHFLRNHPEMANEFHSGLYRMKTKSQRGAPYDYLDDKAGSK
ncbi:hypothetical protein L3Y34_013426 [Caenorhabditis briggsae]|uniref:C2H2-type domain-containing protein n=2 Tax=Caenorhabditis briggsae TaxID=6238 RepID=A0AAE8ZUW9_CAEBR|nr:hypothetical protein L3Y34_013426 [Caenorhabditis briggsae]